MPVHIFKCIAGARCDMHLSNSKIQSRLLVSRAPGHAHKLPLFEEILNPKFKVK